MIVSLRHLLGWIFTAFSSREDLILENLALRQQLLALHAKRPRRRLSILQKVFWVVLKSLWLGSRKPLVPVTPRTVVGWHRAGFRLYWTWVSRARRVGGRRRVSNPTWGAPRIHGELLKRGFRSLGKDCLTLGSKSSEKSGFCPSLANVPQESS